MAGKVSNFTQNTISVIKGILNGYKYGDGFTILKELIQNANDAGAKELVIKHYKGRREADHPLLRVDGIFIYNDGDFSETDRTNIKNIGEAAKKGDTSSIGKYGLGLKSIFHLSDMFFFCSCKDKQLEGISPFKNENGEHQDWLSISDNDENIVNGLIKEKIDDRNYGLVILLPINLEETKTVIEGKRDIDINHPFNKNDNNDERLVNNITLAMSILTRTSKKRLSKITYEMNDKCIEIECDSGADYCVRCVNGERVEIPLYSRVYNDLEELVIDEKGKVFVQKAKDLNGGNDKVFSDYKLVFELLKIDRLDKKSSFKMILAEYLPLPDQDEMKKNPLQTWDVKSKGYDYYMIVHAPFAIDSDRKKIYKLKQSCNSIKDDVFEDETENLDSRDNLNNLWNKILFQYAILPSIPYILKETEKFIDNADDLKQIVNSVDKIFGELKTDKFLVCYYDFIYALSKEDDCPEWRLNKSTERDKFKYVYVPEIFFKNERTKRIIELYNEKNNDVEYLVETNCKYITKQIKKLESEYTKPLIFEFLKSLTKDEIENYKEAIENLGGKIYPINLEISDNEWDALWNNENPYILIPAKYSEKIPDIDSSIDRFIDFFIERQDISPRTKFDLSTSLIDVNFDNIGAKHPSVEMFEVRKISDDTIKFVSYDEVRNNSRRYFFKFETDRDRKSLPYLLNQVLKESLYMIENEKFNQYCKDKYEGNHNSFHLIEKNCKGIYDFLNENTGNPVIFNNDEYSRQALFDELVCYADSENSYTGITKEVVNSVCKFILCGFQWLNKSLCIQKPNSDKLWSEVYASYCTQNIHLLSIDLDTKKEKFIKTHFPNTIRWIGTEECIEELKNGRYGRKYEFLNHQTYHQNANRFKILNAIKDRDLFYRIPLHKNENDEFRSFTPNSMWWNKQGISFPNDMVGLSELKSLIIQKEKEIEYQQEKFFKSDSESNRFEVLTDGIALTQFFKKMGNTPLNSGHFRWILERLHYYPKFTKENVENIAGVKWIPLQNGEICSLNDIISEEICPVENQDVLCEYLGFGKIDQINIPSFDPHEGFVKGFLKTLRHFFDFSSILVLRIKEKCTDDYIELSNYESYVMASDSLKDDNVIFKILSVFGDKKEQWNIYKQLDLATNFENAKQILLKLTERKCDDNVYDLFCQMLRLVACNPSFKITDLSQYPNLKKEWKDCKDLSAQAYESGSAAEENCCAIEIYNILENRVPKEFPFESDEECEDVITELVNNWKDNCSTPKLVNLILYLLQGTFKKVANPLDSAMDAKLEHYKFNESKIEYQIILDDKIKEIAIDGSEQEFKIKDGIIFNLPKYNKQNGVLNIRFFKSNGKNIDGHLEELLDLLLNRLYIKDCDVDGDKDKIVELLKNSSQVTIKAAQNQIQREIFTRLKMLNVDHLIYRENAQLMDKMDYEDEQENHDSDRRKLCKKMLEEVKKNQELRDNIFSHVQEKIKAHQYSKSSVLFELFQNADDCVNDYKMIGIIDEGKRKLEIAIDSNKIEVVHYGRKINEPFREVDESVNYAFKQDLQNMLTISTSNKIRANGQTGKFGLGFKSIYTISKEPVIRSGDNQFKILAGIYPDNIVFDKSCNDSTKIELVCQNDVNIEKDCVSKFRSCAELLTIFAKQINEIEISGETYKPVYKDKVFIQNGNVELAKIECKNETFLSIKDLGEECPYTILFALRDDGVRKLENENYHRVWHLTPLEACHTLPFIINADFEIDPGRVGLAYNPKNSTILERCSESLYNTLVDMKNLPACINYRKYFDGIVNLMLISTGIKSDFYIQNESDSLFKTFATNILIRLYQENDIITNGYGNIITEPDTKNIYIVSPSTFTDSRDGELLKAFQNIIGNDKIVIISNSAYDIYKLENVQKIENSEDLFDPDVIGNAEMRPDQVEAIIKALGLIKKDIRYRFLDVLRSKIQLKDKDGYFHNVSHFVSEGNQIDTSKIDTTYYGESISSLSNYSREYASIVSQVNSGTTSVNSYSTQSPVSSTPKEEVVYDEYGEIYNRDDHELDETDIEKLYDNRDSITRMYYQKIYSSSFYDSDNQCIRMPLVLDENEKYEMNEAWCILLLTAACQSIPYWNHQETSVRKAVEYLREIGVINDFINKENSVKNIQAVYDKFISHTEYEETCLRPFETLLRLYKIREDFDAFYKVLLTLPYDSQFNEIERLLIPSTNNNLENTTIHLMSMDRSFKKGIHFLLRELIRNDFWKDENIDLIKKQAFMPKARILRKIGFDNQKEYKSADIYNRIQEKIKFINDPTLDNTFDILFIAEA